MTHTPTKKHRSPRILYISPMPVSHMSALGMQEHPKEEFRRAIGLSPDCFRTIDATTEELPETFEEDGVIIGGSTFSVYDNEPWIDALKQFARRLAQKNVPTLGVCFGHQILAEALGGKVVRGSKGRELGITDIELTDDGLEDPLFRGLGNTFRIATSHQDVAVTLPEGARILAKNGVYDHQAFGIGDLIRGVQPHPEKSPEAVTRIARVRLEHLLSNPSIMAQLEAWAQEDISAAKLILQNFYKYFVVPNAERTGV